MTNQENITGPAQGSAEEPGLEYSAGQRSITQRIAQSRFDILREKKVKSARGRPFIIGGLVLLVALLTVIGYEYWNVFVAPPKALAIRVGDVEYSRGDVVDLIRFNQSLSEEIGIPFQLGSSVFEALQIIQEAELSFQVAPQYGVAVAPEDLEERIKFILGFALLDEDRDSEEFQVNLKETERQFLNRVGLPENVWKDFLKKALFQERLREVVGNSIPRIQPQVHVYQIMLFDYDTAAFALIERGLNSGANIEDVVLEFSEDFNAARTRGDLGWMPLGVAGPQLDRLLFGFDESGSRILPLRTPATPRLDEESGFWSILIVDEFQDAVEVNPEALEVLKDSAMSVFLNEQRKTIDLYLDLDSDIANWVNKQVRFASLAPTPGPAKRDPFQGLLDGLGLAGGQATVVPTPRGLPGISSPIQ
jgi:hypothetical protein